MAKKNNKKGGLNGLPSDKNKGKGKDKDKGKGKGGGQKGPEGPSDKVYPGHAGATGPGQKDRQHLIDTGKKLDTNPKKPGTQTKPKGGDGGKGGGGGGDINERMFQWQKDQAAKAREDERKRKEKIKKGMDKIDASFAGFDNDFYAGREAKFKEHYMLEAQPQFDRARDNLTFALSRAGLGTTAGTAGSLAETQKKAENEAGISSAIGAIGARAATNTTQMKETVNAEKSNLINQLNSTAAANQVGNQATASATNLASAAPDYNWVPDVFYGAAQGVGSMVQAAQNAQYSNVFNTGSASGSVGSGGSTIK